MMRTILLAGTMVIAPPAIAQTQPSAAPTVPVPTQAPAAPAATGVVPVQPVPTPAPAVAAKPTQAEVAQAVDQQFGTYDRDANGALSQAEFSAWMSALKAQANARAASAAEEAAWNNAAFRQADHDRSATVTKVELTGFLVKGAAAAS